MSGGPYVRGTVVYLPGHFTTLDPSTQAITPADPTNVQFEVIHPDESTTTYTFGVDVNVTHPDVGYFLCALPASLDPGVYHYRIEGSGALIAVAEGAFTIIDSTVLAADPPPPGQGPVFGPCSPWISGADVIGADSVDPESAALLNSVAIEASMALFEISGRQFTGQCQRTVRPCRDNCACWGPSSIGIGPWYWSTYPSWGVPMFSWVNECGDQLGCNPMSRVRLSGYPVVEVTQVLIDGVELPELDTNGNLNWRLDEYTYLTRMDDPGPPLQKRRWPGCQNLSLASSENGTFQISYKHGIDPPQLGRDAAAQIARQLWLAFNNDNKCMLPVGTTRVTRQGVEVERGLLANWFDPSKPTGLVAVDLFLKAYWSTRAIRRPAVFSPDLQPFARPI